MRGFQAHCLWVAVALGVLAVSFPLQVQCQAVAASDAAAVADAPVAAAAEAQYTFPVLWNEDILYTRSVAYADGKTNLTGYLAFYNNTKEQRPVVLIIPDADGIGAYEKWRANLIAALGYIGFVVDIYGDKVKQGPNLSLEQRATLVKMFANNGDQFKGRLMTGLNKMRNLTIALPGKMVAVGYSFGGSGAIQLLRAWPDSDGLLGVVSFHGAPLWAKNFTPITQECPIKVAIFNGAADEANSETALTNFRAEMDNAGVQWQWMDFGHTVSGFSQPDRPILQTADQLIAYNPSADRTSWFALRGFLLDAFGMTNAENPYTASKFMTDAATGFTDYTTGTAAAGGASLSASSAVTPGI